MSESPIPAPDENEDPIQLGRAVRWAATVIGTAALFLFVMNATALHNWASALTPNDFNAKVADVTGDWEALTAKLGLTTPRRTVHDAWANARALTFPHKAGQTVADEPPPR